MKILFLNSSKQTCGVYQYGLRLSAYLPMCLYKEVSDENEYKRAVDDFMPEKIIYNYHASTMSWLNAANIYKNAVNVGITHESPTTIFDQYLDIDPSKPNGVPRPLFKRIPDTVENEEHAFFINYKKEGVPVFGSFGFGFENKGFDKVIRHVNEQFDEAIIKFVIPCGHYTSAQELEKTVAKCFQVERKPGVELLVSNDFFTNDETLVFLASNTMNIFLYDKMEGRGISSVTDYAMSVNTPIGISDSVMFRHMYHDSICVYKTPIAEIIKNYVNTEAVSEDLIVSRVIGSSHSMNNTSNTNICIPVSVGELVDKYSILEIKMRNICSPAKLAEVQREMNSINLCKKYIRAHLNFYKQLVYINQQIWDFTNEIKQMDTGGERYAAIASDIFSFNQKRFRLKKYFNDLNDSSLKEQKSYAETSCRVVARNMVDHLETVGFLCIEYDAVYTDDERVKQVMKNPNLYFITSFCEVDTTIDLDTNVFEIPEPFRVYQPIYYKASGLLGDFIQQLSVVCENFYRTGKKGIVYMTEDKSKFRRGVESTFRDIDSIVKSQYYIEDLRYNESPPRCDVHLSRWRNSPKMYTASWCEIFAEEFGGIEFGKHKWIECATLPEWKSKVVVHTTQYRFPRNVDFDAIILEHGAENVVYLDLDHESGEGTKRYKPASFDELCQIIKSCKLFVGSLSMPLTIAHATHAPRIIGFSGQADDRMNVGLCIPNIVAEM